MSKEVLFVVSFITKLFQELQSKPGDQTISVFWCFLGGAICWNSCQPGKHPLHNCARNSGASACITHLRVNLKNKSDIKDVQGISLVCGHLILNPSGPKDYQSNELDGRINRRVFDPDLFFRIKGDEVSFMGHYSQGPSTQISVWQNS